MRRKQAIRSYQKDLEILRILLRPGRSGGGLRGDLGEVKDMAEVTLNGRKLGIVWCKPFQLEISNAVKNTGNILEINVVNKWSNRLMGDEVLKENYTTGNATHGPILYSSGLLGPVQLLTVSKKELF